MTFYNHIESVRGIAIDLTNGRKWRGASDKAAVFDAIDAARREYMRLSDENAKLRELARMMWLACKSNGIVGGIYAYPDKNSNADERIRFEPLLRELGVEVDG